MLVGAAAARIILAFLLPALLVLVPLLLLMLALLFLPLVLVILLLLTLTGVVTTLDLLGRLLGGLFVGHALHL